MAKVHYPEWPKVGPLLIDTFLYDNYLSFRAKGIMSMLYDDCHDFVFSYEEMAAYSSDPVGAIRSALKELVTLGYLDKKMLRDKNGRFQTVEFTVRYQPRKRTVSGGDINC